jgi:GNAT superfamily N-acetyltransferase
MVHNLATNRLRQATPVDAARSMRCMNSMGGHTGRRSGADDRRPGDDFDREERGLVTKAYAARRAGNVTWPTAGHEPARLAPNQIFEASEILSRVCADDPFFAYLIPSKANRPRLLPRLVRELVRYGYRYGEVYTTPSPIDGVAIWLPPPHNRLSFGRMLVAGLLPPIGEIGPSTSFALLRASYHLERASRHAAPAQSEGGRLLLLGATPLHRRAAIERLLLRRVLERADALGIACGVDTTKAQTVLFYVEHGFRVVAEGDLPGNGPRCWSLRREPPVTVR